MEESDKPRISLITCAKWVPKGVAKENPEKVQLTKQELVQVIKDTQNKLNISSQNSAAAGAEGDEFNLENYDENDSDNEAQALGISSLAELPNDAEENFSESDDSDLEDEIIKPTDNLILVGHVENDASSLEIHVYNEEEESLYVHHDILLPAFPLAIEWLDYEPNASTGNYCAIGTMEPIIQIWDLDIINCIEPAYQLGRKSSAKKSRPHVGHTDAVLALAWNRTFHHVLASGSVDHSVLLWDLDTQTPTTTIEAFADKVQCLQWHRLEAQTLLAGSSDRTVRVFDGRSVDAHQTWPLDGEAESVAWNPLRPFSFFVGDDRGNVAMFDCRKGRVWGVRAHEKEVTGLVVSAHCPGLLVTASSDGTVKTWDYGETEARCVIEKNFNLGSLQCMDLNPNCPFVIAAGGDNKENNFKVYDLRNLDAVKNQFGSRELVELVTESGTNEEMSTD